MPVPVSFRLGLAYVLSCFSYAATGYISTGMDLDRGCDILMGWSGLGFFAGWTSKMESELGVISGAGRLPLFFWSIRSEIGKVGN